MCKLMLLKTVLHAQMSQVNTARSQKELTNHFLSFGEKQTTLSMLFSKDEHILFAVTIYLIGVIYNLFIQPLQENTPTVLNTTQQY